MARIEEVIKFSDYFRVDPAPLVVAGAIDPILNYDSKYFIDPLLIPYSSSEELRTVGKTELDRFFSNLFRLLRASKQEDDVAWRGASKLLGGREVSSINLGYGSTSTRGSSLSRATAAQLIRTAKQIVDIGVDNPDLFMLLPLVEEGVGPDTISDIAAGAILQALAEYTQRLTREFTKLPTETFELGTPGCAYELIRHPYQPARGPILFVPHDIVRELPVATRWSEIERVCDVAQEMREKFNQLSARLFTQAAITDAERKA